MRGHEVVELRHIDLHSARGESTSHDGRAARGRSSPAEGDRDAMLDRPSNDHRRPLTNMAKRTRGSNRSGQRHQDKRSSARQQPRPASRPGQGLSAAEEARAAELESQIVAQERAAQQPAGRSRDRSRVTDFDPAGRPAPEPAGGPRGRGIRLREPRCPPDRARRRHHGRNPGRLLRPDRHPARHPDLTRRRASARLGRAARGPVLSTVARPRSGPIQRPAHSLGQLTGNRTAWPAPTPRPRPR